MIELVCSVKLSGPRKTVVKCMAAAPRKMNATSRKVRGRVMPTIVEDVGGKEGRERSGRYSGPRGSVCHNILSQTIKLVVYSEVPSIFPR